MTCEKCKFSRAVEGATILQCLRYPPTVNTIPMMLPPDVRNPQGSIVPAHQIVIPSVAPEQWCGEFAHKAQTLSPIKLTPP